MGLPGHRRTSSDKRRRASHFALKKLNLAACGHCRKPVLPHHACTFCGRYGARQVIKPQADSPDARAGAGRKPQAKKA